SKSYTIGAVWNPIPSFTTPVDLYQIDLDDRILMSSSMSLVADSVQDYLADNGVTDPQYVALAYFTNAAEMRIRGIGIVTNYFKEFDNGGEFETTVNWAYHKNAVTGLRPHAAMLDALLDVGINRLARSQTKGLLADQMPRAKSTCTNTYKTNPRGFTGTAIRSGGVIEYSPTDALYDDIY